MQQLLLCCLLCPDAGFSCRQEVVAMVVTVVTAKAVDLVGALAVVLVADRDNGPGLEGVALSRGDHQDRLSPDGACLLLTILPDFTSFAAVEVVQRY
ncbi:hypothetical protein [Pseudomonas sp. K5002]|uniref:hypothetical protein n=1 Tax=Pseudomonas sp. K5002 TaxID=2738828 RepID=UPI0015B8154B|nr:hypothetical protein [Pseudomonas sp. K5002]NWD85597.1 hypothetical protein [Pseudomonas sp. K5002]